MKIRAIRRAMQAEEQFTFGFVADDAPAYEQWLRAAAVLNGGGK